MDEPIRNERLGRRLLVLQVAGLGAATVAGAGTAEAAGGLAPPTALVPTPVPAAETVRTDNDPNDSPGYGRRGYGGGGGGRTDNDPRDSPGYGRGYSGGYNAAPQRRSITDNDSNDGQGRGRGYTPPPQRRSVTDNDPNDGQGRGRGWR
ncbi:MAG: hypothetical protein JWP04_3465 [Belnapia sp.]|nr:hypothetical protein [Belnapia sp.]